MITFVLAGLGVLLLGALIFFIFSASVKVGRKAKAPSPVADAQPTPQRASGSGDD